MVVGRQYGELVGILLRGYNRIMSLLRVERKPWVQQLRATSCIQAPVCKDVFHTATCPIQSLETNFARDDAVCTAAFLLGYRVGGGQCGEQGESIWRGHVLRPSILRVKQKLQLPATSHHPYSRSRLRRRLSYRCFPSKRYRGRNVGRRAR